MVREWRRGIRSPDAVDTGDGVLSRKPYITPTCIQRDCCRIIVSLFCTRPLHLCDNGPSNKPSEGPEWRASHQLLTECVRSGGKTYSSVWKVVFDQGTHTSVTLVVSMGEALNGHNTWYNIRFGENLHEGNSYIFTKSKLEFRSFVE